MFGTYSCIYSYEEVGPVTGEITKSKGSEYGEPVDIYKFKVINGDGSCSEESFSAKIPYGLCDKRIVNRLQNDRVYCRKTNRFWKLIFITVAICILIAVVGISMENMDPNEEMPKEVPGYLLIRSLQWLFEDRVLYEGMSYTRPELLIIKFKRFFGY